jgi:hypothetical protein
VRLGIRLTLFGLRIIAIFASGLAFGCLSVLALGATTRGREWIDSVTALSLQFGLSLAVGLGIMVLVMPPARSLTQDTRRSPWPPSAHYLLVILAGIALLQVPALARWWIDSLALARELIPAGPDPLGFKALGVSLLNLAPALASAHLAALLLAVVTALEAGRRYGVQVLAGCAGLEGGLLGAMLVYSHGMRTLGIAVQQWMERSEESAAAAQVLAWVTRYDAAGATVTGRLPWLFAASVLAVLLLWVMLPQTDANAEGELANEVFLPPANEPPPAPNARFGPESGPPAQDIFDDTAYSVRPRWGLFGPLAWSPSEYDIVSIPPIARGRFSFSWNTGTVQREPSGIPVLSVQQRSKDTVFDRRSYEVLDAGGNGPVGDPLPVSSDWEMRDTLGTTFARVSAVEEGAGRALYTVRTDGEDTVRFVWGFLGWTVLSAELQIEFLPAATARTRALCIALAPILERRARLASHRQLAE